MARGKVRVTPDFKVNEVRNQVAEFISATRQVYGRKWERLEYTLDLVDETGKLTFSVISTDNNYHSALYNIETFELDESMYFKCILDRAISFNGLVEVRDIPNMWNWVSLAQAQFSRELDVRGSMSGQVTFRAMIVISGRKFQTIISEGEQITEEVE